MHTLSNYRPHHTRADNNITMLPLNAAMTDPVQEETKFTPSCSSPYTMLKMRLGLLVAARPLRRQGDLHAPSDWLVLERAGDRHCWEVLTEIAAAEKLSAVQSARLRLALSGRLPTVGTKKRSMIGTTEDHVRLPLWHIFRRYTLFNPLEVCFIFTNRPLWYRSVFDALDGDRLRDTLCGSSELILIAAALNMGGLLTLITYDLSRSYVHQASATPLHVICLSVNLFAFLFSFLGPVPALYAAYLPARAPGQLARCRPQHAHPADDWCALLRNQRLGDVLGIGVRGDAPLGEFGGWLVAFPGARSRLDGQGTLCYAHACAQEPLSPCLT